MSVHKCMNVCARVIFVSTVLSIALLCDQTHHVIIVVVLYISHICTIYPKLYLSYSHKLWSPLLKLCALVLKNNAMTDGFSG